MKLKKSQMARYRAAASRLAKLCRAPVVEGSLCRVARGGTERWQLTDKVSGKTRTVYVSQADVEDVRAWAANWREARRLLLEMAGVVRDALRENARGGAAAAPRARTPRS